MSGLLSVNIKHIPYSTITDASATERVCNMKRCSHRLFLLPRTPRLCAVVAAAVCLTGLRNTVLFRCAHSFQHLLCLRSALASRGAGSMPRLGLVLRELCEPLPDPLEELVGAAAWNDLGLQSSLHLSCSGQVQAASPALVK